MVDIEDDHPNLSGSEILDDGGIQDEGVKVRCRQCGTAIVLQTDWMGGKYVDRWRCSTCKNNLAILSDDEDGLIQPSEMLVLSSIPKGDSIEPESGEYQVVRDEHDEPNSTNLAAFFLNRAGRYEDNHIGRFDIEHNNVHVVFSGQRAIAYLSWNESRNGYMVLRQLYVAPSYRRQGIGGALIDYWWKDVARDWCEDDDDYYHVESPNESMSRLIYSIGHYEEAGGPIAYEHQVM